MRSCVFDPTIRGSPLLVLYQAVRYLSGGLVVCLGRAFSGLRSLREVLEFYSLATLGLID